MPGDNPVFDVAIIGMGPAGVTAAVYCARAELSVLAVGETFGGQAALSSDIENYPGFIKIDGVELAGRFKEQVGAYSKIKYFKGRITSIEKSPSGAFTISDGLKKFQAHSVIAATGCVPRRLGIEGEKEFEGKGVSYKAPYDCHKYEGKTVAIVGGGNSALDAAELLSKIAQRVYIITVNKELTGDECLKETIMSMSNVIPIYNAQTQEIRGGKKIESIVIKTPESKQEFSVDGVFVEVGRIPVTDYLKIVDKEPWGEIITDRDGLTNVEGIFAAGDCTNIHAKQIAAAIGSGCAASLSVCRYVSECKPTDKRPGP